MTMWVPKIDDVSGPRYRAIAEAIARAIETRQLRPGQRLPPHRELADRLNVSVQTVSRGYAEAERLRLVSGEIGRGTFVQPASLESISGYIADQKEERAFDFTGMVPIIASVHLDALQQAFKELSESDDLSTILAYRPIAGTEAHRVAGCDWVRRIGIDVSPEQVLITNGGAHGLWVALASVAEPGDVIASESLVDTGIVASASILKLQLRGLALDAEGVIPEAFADLCAREHVKVLCTTPCYNNPTMSLMGEARRREIVEIARQHDVIIIEDDVHGALLADRPRPLWCFAPERTYYVTSFSKVLIHTLRTGYLIGPATMIPRLISRLRTTGWMSNTWTAEVVRKWIKDGTAERLIKWQRERLRLRHAMFGEIMAGHTYQSHPTSLHIWLTLPERWRTNSFVRQARGRRLLVTSPDPFMVGRMPEPHAVRLTIGDAIRDDRELKSGLQRLAMLLGEEPEPAVFED